MFANFLSFPHNYCAKWLWCFRVNNLAIWHGKLFISFNDKGGLVLEGIFNLLWSSKFFLQNHCSSTFQLKLYITTLKCLNDYQFIFLGKTKHYATENFNEKHKINKTVWVLYCMWMLPYLLSTFDGFIGCTLSWLGLAFWEICANS